MNYYFNLNRSPLIKWLYLKWLSVQRAVDGFFKRRNNRIERLSADEAKKEMDEFVNRLGGDIYLEKFIEHDPRVMHERASPLNWENGYARKSEKWKDI